MQHIFDQSGSYLTSQIDTLMNDHQSNGFSFGQLQCHDPSLPLHFCARLQVVGTSPLLRTTLQASSVSMWAVAKFIVPRHVWTISACVLQQTWRKTDEKEREKRRQIINVWTFGTLKAVNGYHINLGILQYSRVYKPNFQRSYFLKMHETKTW